MSSIKGDLLFVLLLFFRGGTLVGRGFRAIGRAGAFLGYERLGVDDLRFDSFGFGSFRFGRF
jgi:hypothetical protein